jgi:hypothetical protein
MRNAVSRVLLTLAVCGSTCATALAAEASIDMELAMQQGFPITGAQRWAKLLGGIGVENVRIRSMRPGDEPSIANHGTESRPRYEVRGVLTSRGDLLLLGGRRFSSRDIGKLKQFLADLRVEGVEGATGKKGLYGITNKQLIAVVEDLTPAFVSKTAGEPLADVVEKARKHLKLDVQIEPRAARVLAAAGPCRQDVFGVSRGTGLAILLGPEGLILYPRKVRGGELQHVIALPTAESEAWPMGWPPESPDRKLAPRLFEFLNVEIAGIPLPKALAALQQRLKLSFLIDESSLARARIEMDAEKVTVPAGRTFYKSVVDRVLAQARLAGEVRVDEAGRPFYWITTIRNSIGK